MIKVPYAVDSPSGVGRVRQDGIGFHWFDHIVFFGSIFAFTGFGIFIAIYEKQKNEREPDNAVEVAKNQMEENMLGGRSMGFIPVGLSLIGGFSSGMFILYNASEINDFGTQYMLEVPIIFLSSAVVAYVFLPVFHESQVLSTFQYLEMRFASILRSGVAIMFVLNQFLFLSMLVHLPAFELSQATGLRIDLISFVMSALTVIYVLIGGMRAVIHTAACQAVLMMLAIFVIVFIGTIQIGGPQIAFKAAHEGGRLIFFNFNPAPTESYTFWTVLIGGFIFWTSNNAVSQTMVQQYMSIATLRKAKLALLLFTIAISWFFLMCCYSGILAYEKFRKCDPHTSGAIAHTYQMLPHYVMQAQGKYHGIPGLLAAAVFAGVLSSSSIVIICTSLVIIEDICKGMLKMDLSEKRQLLVYKLTVVTLGISSFILLFAFDLVLRTCEVLDEFWVIITSVSFGIFSLGMLVPWANTYGTAIGGICGMVLASISAIGCAIYVRQGLIGDNKLPMDVSGCSGNVTVPPDIDHSAVFPLFRLSYFAIPAFAWLTTIVIGTIASFIIGKTDLKTLDARLISPVLHRFLPEESFNRK